MTALEGVDTDNRVGAMENLRIFFHDPDGRIVFVAIHHRDAHAGIGKVIPLFSP